MIDLNAETVISLSQAAKHPALPRRRGGKRPHVSTLYRWSRQGCGGIRLETIRFGATRCTSLEAIQRFANRLTAAEDPPPIVSDCVRNPSTGDAARELAQAGFDE